MNHIRNFSIIAHIDHGKSTCADRLLEIGGLVDKDDKVTQVLDNMELEKERGITIKSQNATFDYVLDGENYTLNLIDTPGHIDFNYEVSRSLKACEGVILLVDCTQGVQAQTLGNYNLAAENKLEVVAAINKVDLPIAEIDKTLAEIEEAFIIPKEEVLQISAKSGLGVEELLHAVIKQIPPPTGDPGKPLKALIFDSQYDTYRGAVIKARVFDGELKAGDQIIMMSTGQKYDVTEVGIFQIKMQKKEKLSAGEVGYVIAGIKDISDTKIGDTITHAFRSCDEALPGFKDVKPTVFAGIYPVSAEEYELLSDALQKLKLNDDSLTFRPDNSVALGFGYRCGFLGLLHMDIIQERLRREFNINIISTAPNVVYRITPQNKESYEIHNPSEFPDDKLDKTEEPYIRATIISPSDYIGNIMKLIDEYRGIFLETTYLHPTIVKITSELPFSEIVYDFNDRLKSHSRGYASFDYDLIGYKESHLSRIDILVNTSVVDALSLIVHRDKAYEKGKVVVEKLRKAIPRQMFDVPIQAAVGGKIIARETIKALRKDVLAKCYGGDISRKRKLLEKQKEGKKRMKKVGSVDIPQEAFLSILERE